MLTFFTTAKPFVGHNGIIQRNALQSWKLLHPDAEVILFGNEEGAAEVCAEFDLRHEPHVERHETGFKYVNYMFEKAQQISRYDFLCYCNCDIVLLNDFWAAFENAVRWRKYFLLVARRWDTDVTAPINFSSNDWGTALRQFALTNGFQQHSNFIDYFVFSKGLYDQVPPLVVGRSYWDHWLVWKALSKGAPVLDCSSYVVPVHQNHDFAYHPKGKQGTHEDALAIRNQALSGNGRHLRAIADSTHELTKNGYILWTPLRRQRREWPFFRQVRAFWQQFMNRTYWIRTRIGLRRPIIEKIFGFKS